MTASDSQLIMMEDIQKVFCTDDLETHALSSIDLKIKHGEFVAISGPSGCGKSTLLSILGLLDAPTSGRYVLDGQAVDDIDPANRARIRNQSIGFIFQNFNLISDLSVFENVDLPISYRAMPVAERKERVTDALNRVGMLKRRNHYPAQLSGGEQQRVAIARAIVGDPRVILADEPTGNLDSRNGDSVMDLLGELHAGGATICVVTHDQRYARAADRIVRLFDGRLMDAAA